MNGSSRHELKKHLRRTKVDDTNRLEERFNFFVSQASAVFTIVHPDGTILYQSPSVKNILGYNNKKRIGQNFLYSKLVHPDDVIIKEALLKKAFSNPNKNFKDELRMLHKNGTWSWMDVVFNNQIDNPDIEGIVVMTYDITERKLLEIQKNEFLSIASHELKTPLTSIRVYGELLLKRLEKELDKKQELIFLDKIVKQTDKTTQLINELLDLGKIQEGKLSIRSNHFQLHLLIKKILDDFQYISNSHIISFKTSTRAYTIGDENRIGQVIINLLTNAIKYSPHSHKISVSLKREQKNIVVAVKDYGDGIPEDKQQYVFQRFFRIDEKNPQQLSSGLGLYIAAEIIHLHHGKIWLKSSKGKGSIFYFSLPVIRKPKE